MGAADRRRVARENAAQRRAYLAATQAASQNTYWHGGQPGLTVGQLLRPPKDVPVALERFNAQAANIQGTAYGDHPGRTDRVYVTTDRQLARCFAHKMRDDFGQSIGALYRVQPIGAPESDPDYETVAPGLSASCSAARIEEVEEDPVVMTLEEERAAAGKYQTWKNGDPMYDADGGVLPNEEMRKHGLTKTDLGALWAPWTPWLKIDADRARLNRYISEKRRRASS
ncbi:hypothetical protein RI685_16335 (plasmid) [Clavibacter michiganensis]|uniref:hypothetical protein n=1 Tax=Clavibacter michiganensis TaxID=28447 RepID=UPI003DA01831